MSGLSGAERRENKKSGTGKGSPPPPLKEVFPLHREKEGNVSEHARRAREEENWLIAVAPFRRRGDLTELLALRELEHIK